MYFPIHHSRAVLYLSGDIAVRTTQYKKNPFPLPVRSKKNLCMESWISILINSRSTLPERIASSSYVLEPAADHQKPNKRATNYSRFILRMANQEQHTGDRCVLHRPATRAGVVVTFTYPTESFVVSIRFVFHLFSVLELTVCWVLDCFQATASGTAMWLSFWRWCRAVALFFASGAGEIYIFRNFITRTCIGKTA